jgi:NADH dehydrogenase [ubiquinone] 1 alpha subcomplex assembly factor 7
MIKEKIKKNKVLPLDQFINFCLYKFKDSYYQKKKFFGHKGDFVTSPHISSIFSEILAIWIMMFCKKKDLGKELNILELGPGDGTMAYDILSTLHKLNLFKYKINYFLLEKSLSLKKQQKIKLAKYNNVNWIENLNKYNKKNTVIISNEFFDALPIKQFLKKNNQWFEKYVSYNKNSNKFEFINVKASSKLIKKVKNIYNLKINNFIEFCPKFESLINKISKILKLKNSIFLAIDYGENSELCNDTLQAIYKNKKNNILKNLGNSDITYNVNFYHLIKLFKKNKLYFHNFMTQSKFLQQYGIMERLSTAPPANKKLNFENLKKSIFRLIHPDQMGNLFKVLIVSKNKI